MPRVPFRLPAAAIAASFAVVVPSRSVAGTPLSPEDAAAARVATVAMHAAQAGALRSLGMSAATNWLEGGRLSPSASEDWGGALRGSPESADASGVVIPPLLVEDFLEGSSVLIGPCDSRGAVFAFSNPFWDALLFVQTGGGALPRPGENGSEAAPSARATTPAWAGLLDEEDGLDAGTASETPFPLQRVPVVEALRWIDGDSFRDEPPPGSDSSEPYAVRIWRVDAANAARFRALHPDPMDPASAGASVRFSSTVAEADATSVAASLQSRAAARAAELQALAGDPVLFRAAAMSATLLRTGNESELLRFFDSPPHAFFCRSLASLPSDVRASFAPCGARTGPDGALILFTAGAAPRFFATVSFPAGRLSGESRESVQMEWYDLGRAEELLAVWERDRKEASR